eukprot:2958780-Rhodomonas_salina.2
MVYGVQSEAGPGSTARGAWRRMLGLPTRPKCIAFHSSHCARYHRPYCASHHVLSQYGVSVLTRGYGLRVGHAGADAKRAPFVAGGAGSLGGGAGGGVGCVAGEARQAAR